MKPIFIAGPCVIESAELLDSVAEKLCEIFADGEIDGIYLNFSDPWPKKKQAKRRLTHGDFLARYDKVLSDDGFVFFKDKKIKI